MTEREYKYNEDYPYLKETIEQCGSLSHSFRVATREYVRVYFPLGLHPGDRVLDVGSNIGTLGHYFTYGGIHTVGIDLNMHAIKAGINLYGKERRNSSLVADGRYLPFQDDSFDAVISQDVFEHLPDKNSAIAMLNEMTRVLKPDRNKMLQKITVLEDDLNIHADESHFLKWTTQEWIEFFQDNGWNVMREPTRKFPIKSNVSYGNFLIQTDTQK